MLRAAYLSFRHVLQHKVALTPRRMCFPTNSPLVCKKRCLDIIVPSDDRNAQVGKLVHQKVIQVGFTLSLLTVQETEMDCFSVAEKVVYSNLG